MNTYEVTCNVTLEDEDEQWATIIVPASDPKYAVNKVERYYEKFTNVLSVYCISCRLLSPDHLIVFHTINVLHEKIEP